MMSHSRARTSLIARTGLALMLSVGLLLSSVSAAFAATAGVRVEGAQRTYFDGSVPLDTRRVVDSSGVAHSQSMTPLSTLDWAAQRGGFPFVLDSMSFGLFVSSIGGELPVWDPPYPGWQYRVNGVSPSVGASAYTLKAGDEVLWYYGAWDASPTVAVVPAKYVPVNSTATITAKQLSPQGAASALSGASVNVGRTAAVSGSDGTVKIKLTAPGDYTVRVAKDGYIRSAPKVVRVRYTTKFSSLKVSKTKVKKGTTVKLTGKLQGVAKIPAGRRVYLYSRTAGTSKWKKVTSKLTSTSGAFSFSVKPKKSTYYRVKYAGDKTFAAASPSASRLVRVR